MHPRFTQGWRGETSEWSQLWMGRVLWMLLQGHPQSQQRHPMKHPILCARPRLPAGWTLMERIRRAAQKMAHGGMLLSWLWRHLGNRGQASHFFCISQDIYSCADTCWTLNTLIGLKYQLCSAFWKWLKTQWILNSPADLDRSRLTQMNAYHPDLF